ncbi:MAG: hypothetical protein K9N21_12825 [Deltaproteobacteria bacterium]|nr:hypothetical protein [Deltaproteobacteria bacterium]
MGKRKRPWQDVGYILGYFGRTAKGARKAYVEYAGVGITQGRREDLTGGGLVRSAGGWSEVKELRRQGQDHVMSDERILGDSKFVESVLKQAAETYDRHYELRRHGVDLDGIIERVAKIYGMEPREILCRGKQQRRVKARSLCCFWAVSELGMSLRELARRLKLSPPAVGFSVERGEAIAHENGYRLLD